MADAKQSAEEPVRSSRAKYVTLAVLVAWVAAVFVFTLFKFTGGNQ
ncbi:MAG: hypothetical protein ABI905_01695 [Betaproteobacteria bacterium]